MGRVYAHLDRVSLKGEEALECMCIGYQLEVDCVYVHTQTHTHKHTYCPCVRHVNTCWHFMNVISHVLAAHNSSSTILRQTGQF